MPRRGRLRVKRDVNTSDDRRGRRRTNQRTSVPGEPSSSNITPEVPPYSRTHTSPSPTRSPVAMQLAYRSAFRARIRPTRSSKRLKRSPVEPTEKSGLVVELFVFLTAYTSLSDEQSLWVVEKVFKEVKWEECAVMDEEKGDGLGDLYGLNDEEGGGLGVACRKILELAPEGVTAAFAVLVNRIISEGREVGGIFIPPAVETGIVQQVESGIEVQANPNIEDDASNWTVVFDHTGSTKPIKYQALPELDPLLKPNYDFDPADPDIIAERDKCFQDYLARCTADDLERTRLEKKQMIENHISATQNREKVARERYWRLVGKRASLTLGPGTLDDTNCYLSDMASTISTSDMSSSIEPSDCEVLVMDTTEVVDWAMKGDEASKGHGIPILEPFPPYRRSESPKRKAAEAGLGDHWGTDAPSNEEEEAKMVEMALQASMAAAIQMAPTPPSDSPTLWEDKSTDGSPKNPWLRNRSRNSIFRNDIKSPPVVFPPSEPLIVGQAMVDSSGPSSEAPPLSETGTAATKAATEGVDRALKTFNEERDKLTLAMNEFSKELRDEVVSEPEPTVGHEPKPSAVDKGKGKAVMAEDKRTKNMRAIFRDLRVMAGDLDYTFRGAEGSQVVTETIKQMKQSTKGKEKETIQDMSSDGEVEGVVAEMVDVADDVRGAMDEVWDILSDYRGRIVKNPEGGYVAPQEKDVVVTVCETMDGGSDSDHVGPANQNRVSSPVSAEASGVADSDQKAKTDNDHGGPANQKRASSPVAAEASGIADRDPKAKTDNAAVPKIDQGMVIVVEPGNARRRDPFEKRHSYTRIPEVDVVRDEAGDADGVVVQDFGIKAAQDVRERAAKGRGPRVGGEEEEEEEAEEAEQPKDVTRMPDVTEEEGKRRMCRWLC